MKCQRCQKETDQDTYCKECYDIKMKEIQSLSRKKPWKHQPLKHND